MNLSKMVFLRCHLSVCIAVVLLWIGSTVFAAVTDTTQAESFSGQSGAITTETCREGGQDVTSIQNGSYIYFNNVDFGTSGIQCFEARIASSGNGGFIQVRLDSQTGTLIGTCEILPPTGGWQTWTSKACSVTGATGVHTLYLVFTNGAGVYTFTNNLFNLNWFKFHGTPTFTYAGFRSTTMTNRGIWNGKCALAAASGTAQVTVDPTTMRQRVDGFGGAFNENGYHCISALTPPARDAIMKELFDPVNGCKFTMGRIPVGISDYSLVNTYSYDVLPNGVTTDYTMQYFNMSRDASYNIPYINCAQVFQPNLMIYASPWTPPLWMKSNKSLMGNSCTPPNAACANMDTSAQTLTAYAMYFRKFIQGYNQHGIPIFVVYPQNEPTYQASYQPSCAWQGNGIGLRDFCSNYLWTDFNANNIGTQIWMGTFYETNFASDIQPSLTDATARTRITGCGTQRGGAAMTNQTMGDANAIANHWHAMETENWSNDGANNWAGAVTCAQTLIGYFEAKVNSFNSWNMILDSALSGYPMNWAQNSLITVKLSPVSISYCPEFYLMKHVSYYVAPGAVSIANSTSGTGLSTTAFKNPDGSIVVFVLNTGNAGANVIRVGSQQFTANLSAASMNTFLLGGSQDTANWVPKVSVDVRYTPPKQTVAANAAARGIMTVYDIKGRIVKVIDRTRVKTGSMDWDRTDASGRKAATGLYLIMNRSGKNVSVQKVMCP
jgi:glucosylceramidase